MKTDVSFEKFKDLIQAIEKAQIRYVVIAGYAIEGRRRKHSRKHSDIDIMFLKSDEDQVEKLLMSLHYKPVSKHDDNVIMKSVDGTKLDIYFVEIDEERDRAVSKGKILTYSFPREMIMTDLQKGVLDGFIFTVAGDSMLKKLVLDSPAEADQEFARTLLGDPKKIGLIKRVPRVI